MIAPANVLLVSASPRRRRLLAMLGIEYDSASVDTPELLDAPLANDPSHLVEHLAKEKTAAAADQFGTDRLILSFDTLVVHKGQVLGKPTDLQEAYGMLRSLSGQRHLVITGMSLLPAGEVAPITRTVTTRVDMLELDPDEIDAWASKGELLGCAGAYNIEDHLASVSADECYRNVSGLPLCHLYALLASGEAGPPPQGLECPVRACDAARETRCLLGPRIAVGQPA